jgi:hypothetical protein
MAERSYDAQPESAAGDLTRTLCRRALPARWCDDTEGELEAGVVRRLVQAFDHLSVELVVQSEDDADRAAAVAAE